MYAIKEARTLELVEDYLTFDEATESLHFYQDICGYDVILTSTYNNNSKRCYTNAAKEYKTEYILYFSYLQNMGNLL